MFVPLSMLAYFGLARHGQRYGLTVIVLVSFAFYASWSVEFSGLLLLSSVVNYVLSLRIRLSPSSGSLITFAVLLNLGALAYYKYAGFFLTTGSALFGGGSIAVSIVVPLGISFITFSQIAYLVDVKRGEVADWSFLEYLAFISYFPHLVSGPLLYHRDIVSQFRQEPTYRVNLVNIYAGFTLVAIGLAKKSLLADPLGGLADHIFAESAIGNSPQLFEAWFGGIAFVMQLYFDLSGYSDIAIGVSIMFNIRLPVNMQSPYAATSMIDYWRRWHISLSSFIKSYVYIPLGGNRHGLLQQNLNVLVAMSLAGLWHGAGWNYVLWGLLNGVAISLNNWWGKRGAAVCRPVAAVLRNRLVAWAMTFLCMTLLRVIYKSESLATAWLTWKGMVGLNGISVPVGICEFPGGRMLQQVGVECVGLLPNSGVPAVWAIGLVALAVSVLCFPTSQSIAGYQQYAKPQGGPAPAAGGSAILRAGWIGLVFSVGLWVEGPQRDFFYFRY